MSKKRTLDENSKTVFLIISIILSVMLVICGITLLLNYESELAAEANINAEYYSGEAATPLLSTVTSLQGKTELIAETVAYDRLGETDGAGTDFALRQRMRDIFADGRFSDVMNVRYFKDGTEYNLTGEEYAAIEESDTVLSLAKDNASGLAGLVQDREVNVYSLAFVAPVPNCEFADSIVVFYNTDVFSAFAESVPEDAKNSAIMLALVSDKNEVLSVVSDVDGKLNVHGDVYAALSEKIDDKATVEEAKQLSSAGKSGIVKASVGSDSHLICVRSVAGESAGLSIVALYRAADIYNSGFETMNIVLGFDIVLLALLLGVLIFQLSTRRAIKKKIEEIGKTDNRLGAPTRDTFEKTSQDIISKNKATSFAVVVLEVKHNEYISEHFGENALLELLVYLKMFCEKNVQLNEFYGYLGSGTYVLLLHYRDTETLASRLKLMYNLCLEYKMQSAPDYHIQIIGGVYETAKGYTNNVSKMINFAVDAKNSLIADGGMGVFKFYNENIQNNRVQNEYVEVHMEQALQNNDFKIFYQPKLNLTTGKPDGSEALVRWLNPETNNYMTPGSFLPLFEANGFIVKLDHYVYEQVCMYIEDAVATGKPVYPVNVNVSRVTATQSDFIPFYVNTKKKHNIADGFIWLEFTESFAYENYHNLFDLVQELHSAGFKCSIDDFGSGYSSYNILKELPMDEIKLDRFFILEGLSKDRDIKILMSVINVAKELGLKVTQEGVETRDQMELLQRIGCNVIQGYHYSKPLVITDFVPFMEKHSKDASFITHHDKPTSEE